MSFIDWLKTPGADRCYLIEADYLLAGDTHTLRLATHPYRTAPTDTPALTPYADTILRLPDFDRELSELFIGTSRSSTGDVELFLDDELLALIETAVFGGGEIRMYIGDARWPKAEFGQILVGRIEQLDAASYDTARLTFRDRSVIFDRPVQEALIASGPNEGKQKPLCFGQCFNVPAVLIDTATRQYQVHDGAVQAITAVRENGVVVPYTANTATGTFTLTYNATGRVTADVQGAVVSSVYLYTADHIITHLVGLLGLAAPVGDALPDYTLGLWIDDDMSIAEALDWVAASVGGAWFFNRLSQVALVHFDGVKSPSDELTPDDIEDESLLPVRRIAPAKSITLGYARNWTPQADGIAGSIRENYPALAVRYEQQEQQITIENAGIVDDYPDAATVSASTLIALQADAQDEAERRADIAAQPHAIYELTAFGAGFALQLGQSITVDYPQYFADGADAVITRLSDLPEDSTVRVEVWR